MAALDTTMAEIVEKFLRHVQKERDRLVSELNSTPVECEFRKNPDFDVLIGKLSAIPVGCMIPRFVEHKTPSSSLASSSSLSSGLGSSLASTTSLNDVESMPKMVGVFKGKDKIGRALKRPQTLAAIPRTNTFAIIHGKNHISVCSILKY